MNHVLSWNIAVPIRVDRIIAGILKMLWIVLEQLLIEQILSWEYVSHFGSAYLSPTQKR
jgi:hypothetical protein